MKTTNTKMKALSLAVLGLVGFGMAGSAMAACVDVTLPGAWTATNVGGGGSTLTVVDGGYDNSACKLQAMLGNNGTARAQVSYTINTAIADRFRAQFIFDPTNLTGNNGTNQAVLFLANAASSHIADNNSSVLPLVKIQFAGTGGGSVSSGKKLIIAAACETNGTCTNTVNLPTQQGANRIEIDLVMGVDGVGALSYWVTDAATLVPDGTPATGTVAVTGGNAEWNGVKTMFLGMSSPSPSYRTQNSTLNAFLDGFDSRRSTFIGH